MEGEFRCSAARTQDNSLDSSYIPFGISATTALQLSDFGQDFAIENLYRVRISHITSLAGTQLSSVTHM